MDDWQVTIDALEENPSLFNNLNQNQKQIASQIANADNQAFYFKQIFESYNEVYNNFNK